jgi:hypothetical protein
MAPIKNLFEGLFPSRLLFLGFATMNPIFGLELARKTCPPHLKLPVLDAFLQGHQTMHLSDNELEVRYCGTIELECLRFKLQKPKLVKLD